MRSLGLCMEARLRACVKMPGVRKRDLGTIAEFVSMAQSYRGARVKVRWTDGKEAVVRLDAFKIEMSLTKPERGLGYMQGRGAA